MRSNRAPDRRKEESKCIWTGMGTIRLRKLWRHVYAVATRKSFRVVNRKVCRSKPTSRRRINVPYTRSHRKVTIYGSLALDGRQFFWTYDRFNAVTFAAYLKELQRHFGKAVLICDRAPQHRLRLVKEFLRKNRNVKIMYFPKGSPYLNAVEECWRQGKRRLLVSEYYRNFSDMCVAISTYYQTARFNLELMKYVNKKTELIHANL